MESVLREEIITPMKSHDLFSKQQFGFISSRSTVLQLIQVLDEWTTNIDEGEATDVIYWNFMKAFDRVPHKRLIEKLRRYGFLGDVLNWITDFQTNRKQSDNQ